VRAVEVSTSSTTHRRASMVILRWLKHPPPGPSRGGALIPVVDPPDAVETFPSVTSQLRLRHPPFLDARGG